MTSHDEEFIDALIEGLSMLKNKLSTTDKVAVDNHIYCRNHEVACGKYECLYADVVNNSVVCTSKECIYQSTYNSLVVDNYDNSLNDNDIVDYPF